ncbi:Phosphoprotein phosphatase [Bertholletia excelsa]
MDQINDIYREQIQALLRSLLGFPWSCKNRTRLKNLNITHILTVACSLSRAHPDDFVYKIIDVPDREDVNISRYFDECLDFIDEAKRMGGAVLVHCFVGRSRSVTIVVAYLMKKHGMSLSEALQLVRSKRHIAAPNSGFMSQLQEFEKSLRGTRTGGADSHMDEV